MTSPCHVGAFVLGSPTAPRALVRHADLLTAYADGVMADNGEDREAYLSHFAFGPDLQTHYATNKNSVAGFVGPCWARWLVLDIDRPDPADALTDARRVVRLLRDRYPEADDVPVWFSGSKGYHVAVELAHEPPPAVGFHRVARTFAETLAARAGVVIDTSIYDVAHIIRLPNTRHPRTGLFKRRIDADALLCLDVDAIRRLAEHPAGDGIPSVRMPSAQLAADWQEAVTATARQHEAREVVRRDYGAVDTKAPRYLLDLLRFGVDEGQRHQTLFRCAAWLTEQGSPPSLCSALLTEPGRDVGLTPKDVERQIQCGIEYARKQRTVAEPTPDSPAGCERWCIQHENDPLPPDGLLFDFGANVMGPYESEGGRR